MPGLRKSLLLGALCATALAPPAHGQSSGTGLYEPFPEPNSIERSKDFVEKLETAEGARLSLSDDELESGVLVNNRTGATRPAPALDRGASERADGGSGLGAAITWALALAVLGLLATTLRRALPLRLPRRT